MLGLKSSKGKNNSGSKLALFLISEMNVFGSTKSFSKMKIKVNPNASFKNKKKPKKENNKTVEKSIEKNEGYADFHLEVTQRIDTLVKSHHNKENNIVEHRQSFTKQPIMPQSIEENRVKNDLRHITFKDFFEKNFPAEYYYHSKGSNEKKSKASAKKVPHLKIKKENSKTKDEIWIDEELKKKHNGLSKKEEELEKEKERIRKEQEQLKKQELDLKKEAEEKLRQKRLEEKQRLKEERDAEKQKRLEERQKLKLEKQKEKEDKIKELLLLKQEKEEEKKKKLEEKKALEIKKEAEKQRELEEKIKELELKEKEINQVKDEKEINKSVDDFDKLALDKGNKSKDAVFFDEDVRKIIPVIDSLLEKLPEDVIEKFSQSDDFALYAKVVSKYKKK